MGEEKRLAAQDGKFFQQLHFFAASGRERGPVVKEKWDVRAERGGQRVQFFRRQRRAEEFIQRGKGHGGIRAAAADATGQWQVFL